MNNLRLNNILKLFKEILENKSLNEIKLEQMAELILLFIKNPKESYDNLASAIDNNLLITEKPISYSLNHETKTGKVIDVWLSDCLIASLEKYDDSSIVIVLHFNESNWIKYADNELSFYQYVNGEHRCHNISECSKEEIKNALVCVILRDILIFDFNQNFLVETKPINISLAMHSGSFFLDVFGDSIKIFEFRISEDFKTAYFPFLDKRCLLTDLPLFVKNEILNKHQLVNL